MWSLFVSLLFFSAIIASPAAKLSGDEMEKRQIERRGVGVTIFQGFSDLAKTIQQQVCVWSPWLAECQGPGTGGISGPCYGGGGTKCDYPCYTSCSGICPYGNSGGHCITPGPGPCIHWNAWAGGGGNWYQPVHHPDGRSSNERCTPPEYCTVDTTFTGPCTINNSCTCTAPPTTTTTCTWIATATTSTCWTTSTPTPTSAPATTTTATSTPTSTSAPGSASPPAWCAGWNGWAGPPPPACLS